MKITKDKGLYTVKQKTKDGRIIECQAFSARRAIEKVVGCIMTGRLK